MIQAGATKVMRCYGFCAAGGSSLLNLTTEPGWSVAHLLSTGLLVVFDSSSWVLHSIVI